ncbi:TPA: hypothetical protein ACS70C_000609 [Providencia alcalifaciens]
MEVDESIFANSKGSEEKRIRMQTNLKEHIEKQKLMLKRLEDIEEWKFLEDPQRVKNNLSGGAFEYHLPNGKGIRYNADGSFNTVLDPKLKK